MKRFAFCVAIGLFAALNSCAGQIAKGQSKDEQEIRALEDKFAAAVSAKDVDAIMKLYVPGDELFVFDLGVPRQYVGWQTYKRDWQDFLGGLKGPVKFEVHDLSIVTDGKIAYSHSIQHGVGTNPDGSPFEVNARVTDIYRKIGGKWLIVHEHVSVPIDFTTGKPDLLSKP